MLAFGLGVLAVAALLRRRSWLAVALVAVAAARPRHHGALVRGARRRGAGRPRSAAAPARHRAARRSRPWSCVAAVAAGPLRGRWRRWTRRGCRRSRARTRCSPRSGRRGRGSANLGLLRRCSGGRIGARARRGDATAEDAALVWGATALVALFLVTLPLGRGAAVAARCSCRSRACSGWSISWSCSRRTSDRRRGRAAIRGRARAAAVAGRALPCSSLATGRGAYVMLVERPERAAVRGAPPATRRGRTPWRWLRRQPRDAHVLADPGHAWKYGTSVRVSAERDVFLEEVKDSALAIYSRDVAVRVVERTQRCRRLRDADRRARARARAAATISTTWSPRPTCRCRSPTATSSSGSIRCGSRRPLRRYLARDLHPQLVERTRVQHLGDPTI